MLADMAMQIEAARALVYECARAGDAGDWKRLNLLASMAKCFGSDMAMKVRPTRCRSSVATATPWTIRSSG